MNIEGLSDFRFYVSVGYVTIIASIITIILMEILKCILRKKAIITDEMDKDKKDDILAKAGRIVAIIIYSLIYVLNELYLKKSLIIDEVLLIGLISGGSATLTVAKGLYTTIRQYQKKKSVYEKLEYYEQTLATLENKLIKTPVHIVLGKKEEK